MKKQVLSILSAAFTLTLAACGNQGASSQSSVDSAISSSSVVSSSEQQIASSQESSFSSSSMDVSSSSIDVQPNQWLVWSEEAKDRVMGILSVASTKETSVVSNTISNGLVANGEQNYSTYTFKKGKRSGGDVFCYHKSPTQTSYYYHDGSSVGGYVEKMVEGKPTYSKATNLNENRFNGYDMSSLMIKSGNGFCGGYASLQKMVDNGISNENKDTKFKFNEDGFEMKYAIYSKVSYTYWNTEISAKFAKDGTLTRLHYKYAESYAKNVNKNEDGTFEFKPEAQLDYKETIYEAAVGQVEEMSMPVEPEAFYYSSFDVYSAGTKINDGDTINTEITDEGVVFDVSSVLPESASLAFDDWVVTVQKEGGKASTDGNYFDSQSSRLMLTTIHQAGKYSVSIKTRNITRNFTVVAGAMAVESISFVGLRQETGGMAVTEIKNTIATGDTTNVCAYVNPIGAPQGVTMTITAPEGVTETDYTIVEKTYKSTDITLVYYEFSSKKAGDFTFKATSQDDPSVSSTHVLKVVAPMTLDEVFDGKYCLYSEASKTLLYTFEFNPNKSTSKLGDGEVTVTTVKTGKHGVYTYAASSGSKTITLTYKTNVDGTVQDLFDTKITTDGTRIGVSINYKDEPVGWPATSKLLDWEDYESKYLN